MGDAQAYEVRVDGPLSDQMLAAHGLSPDEEPSLTLVHTPAIDQSGLLGLIDRLSAFGLELVEVHRIGIADNRERNPNRVAEVVGHRAALHCYEIAVRGLLGPALLDALGDLTSVTARRSRSSTLCRSSHELTALVEYLAEHRAEVISLYRVGHPAAGEIADTASPDSADATSAGGSK